MQQIIKQAGRKNEEQKRPKNDNVIFNWIDDKEIYVSSFGVQEKNFNE